MSEAFDNLREAVLDLRDTILDEATGMWDYLFNLSGENFLLIVMLMALLPIFLIIILR